MKAVQGVMRGAARAAFGVLILVMLSLIALGVIAGVLDLGHTAYPGY